MSTRKVLLYALGTTVVSCILLTLTRGVPSAEKLIGGGLAMFVIACLVLKSSSFDDTRKPNGKDN